MLRWAEVVSLRRAAQAPGDSANRTVALAGTAYGLLLYVLGFLVLTPLVFTTFRMANQPFEVFAHLVFGTLLSFSFFVGGAPRRADTGHPAAVGGRAVLTTPTQALVGDRALYPSSGARPRAPPLSAVGWLLPPDGAQ
jgi:hypothetical protein